MGGFSDLHNASSGTCGKTLVSYERPGRILFKKAEDLHERERDIKAARGKILDIRGNILADNRTVCTVSVIHSQIKDPEKVIRVLSGALSVKEEEIRKKVAKNFFY